MECDSANNNTVGGTTRPLKVSQGVLTSDYHGTTNLHSALLVF